MKIIDFVKGFFGKNKVKENTVTFAKIKKRYRNFSKKDLIRLVYKLAQENISMKGKKKK